MKQQPKKQRANKDNVRNIAVKSRPNNLVGIAANTVDYPLRLTYSLKIDFVFDI